MQPCGNTAASQLSIQVENGAPPKHHLLPLLFLRNLMTLTLIEAFLSNNKHQVVLLEFQIFFKKIDSKQLFRVAGIITYSINLDFTK